VSSTNSASAPDEVHPNPVCLLVNRTREQGLEGSIIVASAEYFIDDHAEIG
jgi:hypothetical protein